ncbi:MAG: BTAD domain-containing putative transcriptional regulator [Candidatus Competibacter sp.]|nr:BTAD domain-containing putative transcriptional regulator [Candidatus Competibacter sp.]
MLLALAYLKPRHPLAPACAERMWQLCRLELPAGERLMAANWLLLYLTIMEDVERMHAAALEFAPLTRSADITPLQWVGWNWSHALYLSCLADFGRCLQDLVDARSLATTAGLHYLVGVSSLLEIWAFLASGDLAVASERLDELAIEIDRARPNDVALYHFLRSWRTLLQERPRTGAGACPESRRDHPGTAPCGSEHFLPRRLLPRAGGMRPNRPYGGSGPRSAVLGENPQHQHVVFQCLTVRGGRHAPTRTARPKLDDARRSVCHRTPGRFSQLHALVVERWPWPVRVYTLGRFALVLDGKPLKATGKPQHRPLELLEALVALGGRAVHGEALIEALWPDAVGLGAQKTLQITVRRLRELLGGAETLRVHDGKLTLDAGRCWVDAWALEELYRRLMVCLFAQGHRAEAMEVYRRCRRHLSILLGIPPAAATDSIYRSLVDSKQ